MFKENFNLEMQNIKATELSKAKLLEKMRKEQEDIIPVRTKRPAKKRWFAAVAAAVAVVIVSVSAFNLPIFGGENNILQTGSENSSQTDDDEIKYPVIEHKNGIPANITYSQVYQLFSAMWKTENERYLTYTTGTKYEGDMGSEEEVIVDEFTDDMEDDEALPGGMGGDTGAVKGEENTGAKPDGAEDEDFSTTNTQVEEVDEADIVKTDGKYIYYVQKKMTATETNIHISKAEKGVLESVSSINISFKNFIKLC